MCFGSGNKYDHCGTDFIMTRSLYEKEMLKQRDEHYLRTRCLPYFHLAGVTKSGTTDLYDKLIKHQDIVEPSMKEPLYYNRHRLRK